MKPSMLLLAYVATITACFPDLDVASLQRTHLDGGAESTGASSMERVTIATFNVEDFDLGGRGPDQYAHVARFTMEQEVDLLLLQEIQHSDIGAFTRALDVIPYAMPHRAFTTMSDGYNAIGAWSRLPIDNIEEVLSENTRTALRFRVTLGRTPLTVYGCHLKAGTDAAAVERRTLEASRLARLLLDTHDPAREFIVVLGDMNTDKVSDDPAGDAMGYLTLSFDNPIGAGNDLTPVNLLELQDSATTPAWGGTPDHILLSPALMVHYVPGSVAVPHPSGDGPHGPSDHYPVLLELTP